MSKWLRDLVIPGAVAGAAVLAMSCGNPAVRPTPDNSLPMPALVGRFLTGDAWAALKPVHQRMLTNIARNPEMIAGLSTCFTPDTDPNVMLAFNQVMAGLEPRFNQTTRWGATAMAPSGPVGTPTILTYSFVPDGTPVPGSNGEPAAPSNLFAFMQGIYGPNNATWQAHYHAIFARWGALCGITYVHEPNDDAVSLGSASGVSGVRGDLRMSGHFIDGPSGVLAYNFFPQNGDMVIDTGDTYFNTTTSNSLRLRNVLAHEHGHGMAQAHVCPITQSKLMEPFISTAYDGPRHDDIRNAQQAYGDIHEPNGTTGTATVLGAMAPGSNLTVGTVPAPAITLGSTVSLNINGDVDFYRISVTGRRLLNVTATPIGENYDDAVQNCSGQSGSCCSGTFTDSAAVGNLELQVIGSNGTTVLAAGSSAPAGSPESLSAVVLPAAGDYYIRVSGVASEVQLYTLTLGVTDSTVDITLPNGTPDLLTPGQTTSFAVQVTSGSQTVTSATLHHRSSASTGFTSVPLTHNGGTSYTAVLPAFQCGQTPQFYIQATGNGGAVVRSPIDAPTSFYAADVGEDEQALADNFETDLGWTVQSDATVTSGAWVRVDPVGTSAQPEDDHTPAPGTQCFVTGQGVVGGAVGAADLDGGATHLTSPVWDATGAQDVLISYWRWYSNTQGAAPAADVMTISVSSNNGGAWTTIETIGPATENNGGWIQSQISLDDFPAIARTAQMRLRFTASDLGTGSLVEAAVDDVEIDVRTCTTSNGCGTQDFNGDGDFGTDQDIEAFFACLAGSCCPTCFPGGQDFNGDGDFGTDQDIEAFFRVLAGGTC